VASTGAFAQKAAPAQAQQPAQQVVQQQMDQAAQQVELTGTLTSANQFIADSGENYQLIPSAKSTELREHLGEKVKLKATVMEDNEGFKSIDVSDYEVLKK
jgi:uncharacterized protein YbcI